MGAAAPWPAWTRGKPHGRCRSLPYFQQTGSDCADREWEAPPQRHPGWVRATALAESYPAVFRAGETVSWAGGSGVLSGVYYDK